MKEELFILILLYMTGTVSFQTVSVLHSGAEVCLFSICWNLISRDLYLSLTHTPASEYVSGVSIQLSNAERTRQRRKQSERNESWRDRSSLCQYLLVPQLMRSLLGNIGY